MNILAHTNTCRDLTWPQADFFRRRPAADNLWLKSTHPQTNSLCKRLLHVIRIA